jgi:hypothetical protein
LITRLANSFLSGAFAVASYDAGMVGRAEAATVYALIALVHFALGWLEEVA